MTLLANPEIHRCHFMRDAEIELPLQDSVVYGPIASRRLGYSLGINLLPLSYKFCNFDCVYCQYGPTSSKGTGERIKPAVELLAEIRAAFEKHKQERTPVDCLTIAGNGEPTLHPQFPALVEGLLSLRDQYYPGVKTGILSNASQVHRKPIRTALDRLDERYMKLDAGTPEKLREINRSRGHFDFSRTVRALASMKGIVIQTLFVQGSHDNTTEAAVTAWIKTVKKIKPREVQVYTIDRKPADPHLRRVPFEKLQEIADRCQRAAGITAVVYD
ncbi:MAG: radical SAM protein [Candidatus Omnitrophota bacterium]